MGDRGGVGNKGPVGKKGDRVRLANIICSYA